MTRLRIALVANNIHFRGGMERYFAELARALCQDHEVHLFATEVDDVPFDKLTVHHVQSARRPILALFIQYYLNSSRQVRLKDYDIVHAIGGITAHQNIVTAQFCQHAWGDAIRREPGAAEGITAYHRFMWRFAGYFEKRALTSPETRRVSANSCHTRDDLQKYYGCDPAKTHVIYNGVDPVRFTPENARYRAEVRRRYGLDDQAIVVLFVGEYRRKGLATVIRALGLLNDRRVHLLAVGKGNVSEYQALAAAAGIADRVTLAGPDRAIERVFGASDVFAFPTYYEPFGMVITEAMASGLPVVTSRNAGAAEMIADGTSGFLVERPGDHQELARALHQLLEDPDLRTSVGIQARRSVSGYDWSRVAEETRRMYAQALGLSAEAVTGKMGIAQGTQGSSW